MIEMEVDGPGIIRQRTVLRWVGVSRATLARWISAGRFPAPVRLGANSIGFHRKAVVDWLESREVARPRVQNDRDGAGSGE